MKLGFEEPQRSYSSGSQRAKAWTEQWVSKWAYCANCGNDRITQLPANLPVADFYCTHCGDQYELKSQKKPFGARLANGAYATKCERLLSASNPNLILLNYDLGGASVRNVCVVPKHFFVPEIVEKRKPLRETAQRAGWVGSNILLSRIPEAGRIFVVQDGVALSKEAVLAKWKQTLFLREKEAQSRGWLIDVMKCVEKIGTREFDLDAVYAFEAQLEKIYPNNNNVRPKIRQQLQVLRDNGYLDFLSRGRYRIIVGNER